MQLFVQAQQTHALEVLGNETVHDVKVCIPYLSWFVSQFSDRHPVIYLSCSFSFYDHYKQF